jgi:starch phosphorylase
VPDGRSDIRRATAELAERVPEPLEPLAQLAYNYAWSWLPGGHDVFRAVDPERFELVARNPVRLLQEASTKALRRAAADSTLVESARRLLQRLQLHLQAPANRELGVDPERPVAFLCAEYGVHVSLPVYSGGLGALAGDILKEASDRRLPMVGVGLMYRRGYFRQRIDAGGWQHEYWVETDPDRLPAALVTGQDGNPITVEVPIGEAEVEARIWRIEVGRVPLLLLDTDFGRNDPFERWITARLYDGDTDTRLAQYVLLGVGGVRALRALGIEPALVHLNEGHAALAPVELALGLRAEREEAADLDGRLDGARARTVFTTHTPVPAGNDSYPPSQVSLAIAAYARAHGVQLPELIALGQTGRGSDPEEPFGVTQAALRLSRAANGVSRRHGEVARAMWTALWPGRSPESVPIGHVTNGVHIPTWLGDPMRELLDRHLGEGWIERSAEPGTWEAVHGIPSGELWEVRERQRAALIEFVCRRSTRDRLERTDLREYVLAAARAMRPDVLTLGFARRVATYKRLDLLIRDAEWAISLLGGERPVQLVLAGKAHPRDDEAKRVLQRLFGLKGAREIAERVVFLDDYDLATGAALVRGCDVWLNLPRPPLEASGTSGMKSAINGGLQLSVLDGWWAEAYEPGNGWAIPGGSYDDPGEQDARDVECLHRLLADEVVPAFYDRGQDGVPERWVAMIKASLTSHGPRFSAARMLADYARGPYAAGELTSYAGAELSS